MVTKACNEFLTMEREGGVGIVCDDKFLVQTMPIQEEDFRALEDMDQEDMNEVISQCSDLLGAGAKSAKKSMKLMVDLLFPASSDPFLSTPSPDVNEGLL